MQSLTNVRAYSLVASCINELAHCKISNQGGLALGRDFVRDFREWGMLDDPIEETAPVGDRIISKGGHGL
jgi:hypothetical protein